MSEAKERIYKLGEAIYSAVTTLPDRYTIEVRIGRFSLEVLLTDPAGNEVDVCVDDMKDFEVIHEMIAEAIRRATK